MQCHRLLLAAVLLLGAHAADAQVHLHGRVLEDATSQPLEGATVTLRNARGRVVTRATTDEAGRFNFVVDNGASARLQAERIGYRASLSPVLEFDGYAALEVEIRLDVAAVLLAPVTVVARARSHESPMLAGFESRRTSGAGWHITRAEIEKRNVSRVSDIVAMAPGVSIQRRVAYMSRGGDCPAQIFIDGAYVNRPMRPAPGRRPPSTTEMFPIDDLVKPSVVEGIEVYQGVSRIPSEFSTQEAACGVIAIWTRRGG